MLTIITGPPCSGKTTYARTHARPGDIVVDFDALAQALGSPVSHGHDHHLWKVAIEARTAAVRAAIQQHRQGATAWIVDSRPTEAAREAYRKAGGRIVDLTATREELHRRASEDRPASWHARIDTFLDGHDPQPRTVTRW
jgi:broad-specificity NMP kinase